MKGIYKGIDEKYLNKECTVEYNGKCPIGYCEVIFEDGVSFTTRKNNVIFTKENNAIVPAHYHKGNIDTIKFCEENFNNDEMSGAYKFNIIKYVHRYKDKNGLEDLKKAEFYLNKLIELEEKGNE